MAKLQMDSKVAQYVGTPYLTQKDLKYKKPEEVNAIQQFSEYITTHYPNEKNFDTKINRIEISTTHSGMVDVWYNGNKWLHRFEIITDTTNIESIKQNFDLLQKQLSSNQMQLQKQLSDKQVNLLNTNKQNDSKVVKKHSVATSSSSNEEDKNSLVQKFFNKIKLTNKKEELDIAEAMKGNKYFYDQKPIFKTGTNSSSAICRQGGYIEDQDTEVSSGGMCADCVDKIST